MICSSLNLDRFIVRLPYLDGLYINLEEFQGLRSESLLHSRDLSAAVFASADSALPPCAAKGRMLPSGCSAQ